MEEWTWRLCRRAAASGTCTVATEFAWLDAGRRNPDERRFPAVGSLVETVTRSEWRGRTTAETRYFISSEVLTPERAAAAIRSHWTIESMHRVLDVIF